MTIELDAESCLLSDGGLDPDTDVSPEKVVCDDEITDV